MVNLSGTFTYLAQRRVYVDCSTKPGTSIHSVSGYATLSCDDSLPPDLRFSDDRTMKMTNVALPLYQNKSFTVTLFAYDTTFTAIAEQLAALVPGQSNPVIDLFRKEFPDALALMGEEGLLENWRENPKDGLVTIEVSNAFS